MAFQGLLPLSPDNNQLHSNLCQPRHNHKTSGRGGAHPAASPCPTPCCTSPAGGLGCSNCGMLPSPRHLAAQHKTMPDASGYPGLKASFLPSFKVRGAIPQKKALLPSKGFCSWAGACPESAAFISQPSVWGCCSLATDSAKRRPRARYKSPAQRKYLAPKWVENKKTSLLLTQSSHLRPLYLNK